MNDDRTEKEKYDDWVDAVNKTHKKGWRHVNDWVFLSPVGTFHDLSAADLNKLDDIQNKKLMISSSYVK